MQKEKMICIVLTFVLIIGALPVPANAAEIEESAQSNFLMTLRDTRATGSFSMSIAAKTKSLAENATALTEEILITNTTKIKISVQHLGENEIIDVYLYDANQADVIVAYTRLSEDEHSFTFTGLKSTIGYQIGAESINLLESKSLKITD